MEKLGLAGLRVAAFESRMEEEMSRLIRKCGGDPLVTPSLREIPLEDNHPVFIFGTRLLAGELDMVIFLTGVGVRYLMEILETRHARESLTQALSRVSLVVRGPKPMVALRELGLSPTITVPEPNTWRDLLHVLDESGSLTGLRIAVQEYGASNPDLLEGLHDRGSEVLPVPVYKWGLPENVEPLRHVLQMILNGLVDVMLITNAAQIDNIVTVLEQTGQTEAFRRALQRTVVGSIGPTASARLHDHGLPVDLEPSHPKMGHLVKEMSERAEALLAAKRKPVREK